MPAAPHHVADYERLARKHQNGLSPEEIPEIIERVKELVPLGRYSGPRGVFIATGIRTKPKAKAIEDIYVAFFPLHGGEELQMPVLNCMQFYQFLCPELI